MTENQSSLIALVHRERLDFAILVLISLREGWSASTANDEQGYFDPEDPRLQLFDEKLARFPVDTFLLLSSYLACTATNPTHLEADSSLKEFDAIVQRIFHS